MLEQNPLFVAGRGGYDTYRIPSLLQAKRALLAFCEARRDSRADAGQIDLVMKRSLDGGKTWSAMQILAKEEGVTSSNPCPVLDEETATIWLPFCKNPAKDDEPAIVQGHAQRSVWMMKSVDDGETWSEAFEISSQVKKPDWSWYATGPGHGIQLKNGRLLIPCNHAVALAFERDDPHHSHVFYSDDHGKSWQLGGSAPDGTNECEAVELSDGSIYLNCRNFNGTGKRGVARSFDRGQTFSEFYWDEALTEAMSDTDTVLPEPKACQASIIRLEDSLLFCNPAGFSRDHLTIRVSFDQAKTWATAKILCEGPSAYSDLTILPDKTIACLYEAGRNHPYESLVLARFDVDWLQT
ncbi:MAG: exo-alpha-sialidase [Trueperaceae bacterium]|nr:exo-alpha-sialidase [Trueperaceae bacterium]